MKLGILGTGMIVQYGALPTIEQLNLEYVSILGVKEFEEQTKELTAKYKLDRYHLDYNEMLDTAIDTVYVALPNSLHFEFAKKALLKGKNVIIEKPITVNTRELKELNDLASEYNLIVIEAMTLNYLPAFHGLKEKLVEIGDPKIVNFNYSQYSSRYDAFKNGEILPAFDYRKAGGSLMDINVYNINAIVGLFGAPISFNYFANIEKQIDTSGVLVLDYGKFKAVAIGAKDCNSPNISTIQGDKGSIIIEKPFNSIREFVFKSHTGEPERCTFEQEENKFLYEFREFVRIMDTHDLKKANQIMEVSKAVADILETARNQQEIVFPSDAELEVR